MNVPAEECYRSLRYGPSAATAEIKDHCPLREHLNKSIMPTLVVPRAVLTIAIPRHRVPLIVANDALCQITHSGIMRDASDFHKRVTLRPSAAVLQ